MPAGSSFDGPPTDEPQDMSDMAQGGHQTCAALCVSEERDGALAKMSSCFMRCMHRARCSTLVAGGCSSSQSSHDIGDVDFFSSSVMP